MPLLFVSLFYKGPFVSGPARRVDSLPRQLLTGGYEAAVGASLAGGGFLGEEKRIRLQAGSYRGMNLGWVLVENRRHRLYLINAVDPVFQLLSAGAVQPGFDLRRHFAEAAP